ncbi:MAG: hypothetical protein AAFR62_12370 [Cyanobacteria bacterium J06629_2]
MKDNLNQNFGLNKKRSPSIKKRCSAFLLVSHKKQLHQEKRSLKNIKIS